MGSLPVRRTRRLWVYVCSINEFILTCTHVSTYTMLELCNLTIQYVNSNSLFVKYYGFYE